MSAMPADVVVVGLGPAGSSAARAAAAAGARVVAFDRRRIAGEPVQCAELVPRIMPGDTDAVRGSRRQAIDAMHTFVEDARADVQPDFPGWMIDRRAFDAALVDAARAAGADCRFGAAVAGIARDGCVRLANGTVVAPRVIVGADGPRSAVARAAGLPSQPVVHARQITVPLTAAHAATDIFLSADYPGGYGWLFPRGTCANVGIGVVPAARAVLKPALVALHGRLVTTGRVGRSVHGSTGGAIPVGGLRRVTASIGRCHALLAGDAAGLANPVTGAGISAAVQSGALAGDAAAGLLGGDPGAPADYAAELEDLFGAALLRAVRHRESLLSRYAAGERPDASALRAAWIAYPEYWAA